MTINDDDVSNDPIEGAPNAETSEGTTNTFRNTVDTDATIYLKQGDIELAEVITIRAESRDSPHWAEIRVSTVWSEEGGTFTWTALEFRTYRNDRYGLGLLSCSSRDSHDYQIVTGRGSQDGQWNQANGRETVSGNSDYADVGFKFEFEVAAGFNETLTSSKQVIYQPVPLIINQKSETDEREFEIHGTKAARGALLFIYKGPNDVISNGVNNGDGTWKATVRIAQGLDRITLTAKQSVNGRFSELSNSITVVLKVIPIAPVTIETPKAGDVITVPKPTISGTGHSGATIVIYEAGLGGIRYGSGTVSNGSWSIPLTEPLPHRRITLVAGQTFNNGVVQWSNEVPITVAVKLQTPVITTPAADPQNFAFILEGTGGVAGSLMQIVYDLDHSQLVGQAAVTADAWEAAVIVEPGRRSLVAGQTGTGYTPSDFSQPRVFDIRPFALTRVNVTFPDAITVKFAGGGREGATVVITVLSGPGGAAPGEAWVVNGKWETSAANWPDGLYKMRAIQKISNNAGGWIESRPIEFDVTYEFPLPSDVKSTPEYQTTFSGKGLLGATVSVLDSDKLTKIAPDAPVRNDDTWSTRAYAAWGPIWDRTIYVHQFIGSRKSASVEHKVRIPPIAPGIGSVSPEGLSPTFTGTCELNAEVNLVFSDGVTSYPAVVTGRAWSFQRALPFTPDIEYTVTATQIAAQQTSPAASRQFKQQRPMVAVVITHPAEDSEIGHGDVTFKGTNGMKGATVSVWDYVNGGTLGSVTLEADGPWEIVVPMTFDRWVVRAKQVIEDRESDDSDLRVFNVVLLQPEIDEPPEAGTLTRTSMIEGTGEPLGYVDVFQGISTTPFLVKVPIGINGRWKAEAIMPVGNKTIRARQYFQNQTSKDTQPRTYKVVPHSPFMETPAAGEHVGKRAMVSGFGVWGDKVKVKLGSGTGPALGEALVGEDRAWSILVEILRAGPAVSLVATSSEGAFESAASAPRSVLAGVFEPTLQSPAEGRPVPNPVHFAGTGRDGEAQLCSWYNPEVIQASGLPVTTATGWQGTARIALLPGGNWSVIQQTLTMEQDGATVSDNVTSHRFEVEPVPSEGKSSDVPDKWSL